MKCKIKTDGSHIKFDRMLACNIYEDTEVFSTTTYHFERVISNFDYGVGSATSEEKSWETNYGL